MALAAPYATVGEYSAQKGKLTSGDDLSITRELIASSRLVDQIAQRPPGFFNKDDSAVARTLVVPVTDRILDLPYPLVSATSIEVDLSPSGTYATALATTDYELLPSGAALSGSPSPYTQIGGLPWANNPTWYEGSRVRITGVWGWPEVPAAVVAATIELTAILRVESPRATGRIQEGNLPPLMVSRSAREIVERMLMPYLNAAAMVG